MMLEAISVRARSSPGAMPRASTPAAPPRSPVPSTWPSTIGVAERTPGSERMRSANDS